MKMVKNQIEKKRRKRREMILREKISELETCYQARDTRKYWNKLKEVGGWKRKGGGRIPETAVDEEGKEHTGQDVLKVWRDSFFQLESCRDFDRSLARDVERKVSEYEREEEKGQEESERLNEDITQEEVNKAMNKLKNEKAAGA